MNMLNPHISRIVRIVENHVGRLNAEDMAKVVTVADAADMAEERRVIAEEASIPLLTVERIEDGWLVTYKDDDGKPWRKAFVREAVCEDDRGNFEELVWHLKDVLCPDLARCRMEISFTKDE